MNSDRVKLQLCDPNGDQVFTCSPPVDVAAHEGNFVTWQGRVFRTEGAPSDSSFAPVYRAHEVRVYAA